MKQRLALAALALLAVVSCSRAPDLSREQARGMIENSVAFREDIGADVRKALSYEQGTLKREILRVEAVTRKADGPFGSGETATVVFAWRWTGGPLAGAEYRTATKFHGTGKGWTLYEDKLKKNLRETIGGEE